MADEAETADRLAALVGNGRAASAALSSPPSSLPWPSNGAEGEREANSTARDDRNLPQMKRGCAA